ncbi:MAG TPA: MFS transporter [Gammaproteobacteria bacterium]
MLNRNILILFVVQSLGMSTIFFLTLIAGIMAARIGPSERLATLPVALAVIGTAFMAIPAAMFMQRFGRRAGFIFAHFLGLAGMVVGFCAAWFEEFYTLCLCSFLTGCFLAFIQQARFAAIESSANADKAGQVVSFLLFGGVIAAFFGPEIGQWGKNWLRQEFAGSFLIMTVILMIALALLYAFRNPVAQKIELETPRSRPLFVIARQPVFFVALAAAVTSYAVMSFLMTATPISMNHIDGFDFSQTKRVIQWHIAAMFLPSVFNILLFRYIGLHTLMFAGAVIYLVMGILALQGHGFMHYSASLILLGVGWNFLFVAGTALLPQAYRYHERYKVQAANDFIVYAVQAVSALSAGWLLFALGWDFMVKLTLPVSGGMLLLAIYYYFAAKKFKTI